MKQINHINHINHIQQIKQIKQIKQINHIQEIHDFAELSPLLSGVLGRGVITNTFLSEADWRAELAVHPIRVLAWDGGLLLFRARDGYQQMNFYLRPPYVLPELEWDGILVTEFPVRPRESGKEQPAILSLECGGFRRVLDRVRLARAGQNCFACPANARLATESDLDAVFCLLRDSFPALTGCLPVRDALIRDIQRGYLAVAADENDRISALLHFVRERNGAEIRHLCTRENARGNGLAQAAFDCFCTQVTGNVRVWTGQDNLPALRFYERNGFAPDGWTSAVLVRDGKDRKE